VTPQTKPRHVPLSDASFDFPVCGHPKYFYFVASTERSGSTYLCTMLWRTGILGAPVEYFNFNNIMLQMTGRLGAQSLDEYLRRLFEVRSSPNGVFGAKIHWPHLQFLILSNLLGQFPNARWIFIDRRDAVAQAVSYAKAVQTQQWRFSANPQATSKFDFGMILRWYKQLLADKNGWHTFLRNAKVQPLTVFYEDFVDRPDAITAEIVAKLGFPTEPRGAPIAPDVLRQGDETNLEWTMRFRDEAAQQGVSL
jgi:LPS sulfotransferase NodH